jgi:DNA-binding Xre family transcriptional regulator
LSFGSPYHRSDRLPVCCGPIYPDWMATLNLGKALKRKKLSKRKFAKLLGMSYNNVFRLFRDGQDPKLSTLTKWAKILKLKVRDLIED